jgi:hypothetical protein
MILKSLREEVLEANLELVRRGLVMYTFGNASGISREKGLVAIKPSGVPYETMKRKIRCRRSGSKPLKDRCDHPPTFRHTWFFIRRSPVLRYRAHAFLGGDGVGSSAREIPVSGQLMPIIFAVQSP